MRFKIIQKKKAKLLYVVIVIALITIGTTIFLIYLQSFKEISDFYEISSEEIDISEIEIDNQIQIGDITLVQPIKNPINIIEAKWKVNYKGIYNPDDFIIISYEINVSILKIYIHSNLDEQALSKDVQYSTLTLYINPNYALYGFISNSKKGNIKINTRNINISIFKIETSSGNIDVQLNNSDIYDEFKISTSSGAINLILDNINFFTDFLCVSDSSYQYHDFWNIRFLSGADFTAMSSTGRVKVRWANHFLKSQNVNILLTSNDNVEFRFWSRIEIVRFDLVLLCSDEGTTLFRGDPINFEEIETNHYRSHNFNNIGLDLLNIKVVTYFGEAQVWHTDCFKMKRFCNLRDIDLYEENTKGDYILPKNDYNVTQLELYNVRYIYLNITKALNLNLELLPNISENIIYLIWDLTYIKGSAYGIGDIKVQISSETEVSTLKVYSQLKFELDRILPTFTKYNITAFVHPDYNFYNYTI